MTVKATKPLRPSVTLDEVLRVVPGKPETYTSSPVVNAVIEAFHTVRPLTNRLLEYYLQTPHRHISTALSVITGFNLTDLMCHWRIEQVRQTRAAHPDWTSDQLAQHCAFYDRSSMWRLLKNKKYMWLHPDLDFQKWYTHK